MDGHIHFWDALRELFQRKALVARQARLCEALLAGDATPEEIAAHRVSDLPDDSEGRRCVELREQLGIAAQPGAPAFVLPDAPRSPRPTCATGCAPRVVRVSLEANGGICRSLLAVRARYDEEVAA